MSQRFGRYETIQEIAKGGMATVYLARAVGVGGFERRVAVKVMHDHIADDPGFITMFLDEARLAARIHHPNVVSTIDVQKTDNNMFLVMEYIEGASLRDVLRLLRKQKKRMPVDITIKVVIDTLQGLHAAHELKDKGGGLLNLVHRDVSPHNVLIGTDGISRITDFGVARAEARLSSTRGGTLKGKIAYMPPEQGRGDDIDRRADVYAAGVVLWEALTGKRLFKADHEGALIAMIMRGTEQSPRSFNPSLPFAISAVCMQALAVDPDDRFDTAADFAEALEIAALETDVTLASQRKVARFVDAFKVTFDSIQPPAHDPDETGPFQLQMPSQPSSSEPTGSAQTGSAILDVASVPSATSQLSGIGAVRSWPSPPPVENSKKMLFAGLGGGAFLAIVAVVVVGSLAGAESVVDDTLAAQPATEQPVAEPEPEPDPVVEPEPEPEPVAEPEPEPSASTEPEKKTPKAVTPRRTGGKVRRNRGPLGYEPDDL
jgi:serine/threonine protein kinase